MDRYSDASFGRIFNCDKFFLNDKNLTKRELSWENAPIDFICVYNLSCFDGGGPVGICRVYF